MTAVRRLNEPSSYDLTLGLGLPKAFNAFVCHVGLAEDDLPKLGQRREAHETCIGDWVIADEN